MKIAIGSDHLGLGLKTALISHLKSEGYDCDDLGTHTSDPVDYPDIAERLALSVARGEHPRGILICGTGIGMAIVANKVPGVRAAQVHDPYSAERARKSNDAQIMTLGAQVIGAELAKELVSIWLRSEFAGGRSTPKVEKIVAIDEKYRSKPVVGGL
jgi:ribose 5-phosphate isomerase B